MLRAEIVLRSLNPNIVESVEVSEPLTTVLGKQQWFEVICRIRGFSRGLLKEVLGYGVGLEPHLPRLKAIMEAVERWAISNSSVELHGSTAAHFGRWQARCQANDELVERDAYIRWALGITAARSRVKVEREILLELPSRVAGRFVYLAAYDGMTCVPFGLGVGKSQEIAANRAKAELVMSLLRHHSISCESEVGLYSLVHRASARPEFRKRIWDDPVFNYKTEALEAPMRGLRCVELVGVHRWPVVVVSVSSPDFFLWDLEWFANPGAQPDHANSQLCHKYGAQMPLVISTG